MSRMKDKFIDEIYPEPIPADVDYAAFYGTPAWDRYMETCRQLGHAQGLLQSAMYALRSPDPDGDLAQRIEDYLVESGALDA